MRGKHDRKRDRRMCDKDVPPFGFAVTCGAGMQFCMLRVIAYSVLGCGTVWEDLWVLSAFFVSFASAIRMTMCWCTGSLGQGTSCAASHTIALEEQPSVQLSWFLVLQRSICSRRGSSAIV